MSLAAYLKQVPEFRRQAQLHGMKIDEILETVHNNSVLIKEIYRIILEITKEMQIKQQTINGEIKYLHSKMDILLQHFNLIKEGK